MYKILLLRIFLSFVIISPSLVYGTYWSNESYTHYSKDEPLSEMLNMMAADKNISIVVSNKITENISAYFRNKTASDIFSTIKHTYNLSTYFDGKSLYIYKTNELKIITTVLSTSPIKFLEKELISNNYLNEKLKKELKWNINKKRNSVTFHGSARFSSIVNDIATSLDKNRYIYKWQGENQHVHYSNEPPFGEVNFLRILSLKQRPHTQNIDPVSSTLLKKHIKKAIDNGVPENE